MLRQYRGARRDPRSAPEQTATSRPSPSTGGAAAAASACPPRRKPKAKAPACAAEERTVGGPNVVANEASPDPWLVPRLPSQPPRLGTSLQWGRKICACASGLSATPYALPSPGNFGETSCSNALIFTAFVTLLTVSRRARLKPKKRSPEEIAREPRNLRTLCVGRWELLAIRDKKAGPKMARD